MDLRMFANVGFCSSCMSERVGFVYFDEIPLDLA